ncbi:hypothetical protein SM033_00279 [Vibrio phage vB_VpaM_sm033]|nr:hypothetical protein SM033_00279 [Vibrio phage vB_VpaM_sm033]
MENFDLVDFCENNAPQLDVDLPSVEELIAEFDS